MNPAFSGDPNRPEFAPGANPTLFGAQQLASTGGDPNVSGQKGPGTLPQTPPTPIPASAGGKGTWNTSPLGTGGGGGAGPRPNYIGGGNIGNSASGREKDPAWRPPGMQESFKGTYDQWRGAMAERYPWMSDTSIQWGGGPEGYLPLNYQAQDYRYYQQPQGTNYVDRNGRISVMRTPGTTLAPWESAFAQNTWTQNIDPSAGGYYDPQRVQNDPNYNPRA